MVHVSYEPLIDGDNIIKDNNDINFATLNILYIMKIILYSHVVITFKVWCSQNKTQS